MQSVSDKVEFLKSEVFRLSGWEKKFIRGIEKKKEEELSWNQKLWLSEICGRVLKQKQFKEVRRVG